MTDLEKPSADGITEEEEEPRPALEMAEGPNPLHRRGKFWAATLGLVLVAAGAAIGVSLLTAAASERAEQREEVEAALSSAIEGHESASEGLSAELASAKNLFAEVTEGDVVDPSVLNDLEQQIGFAENTLNDVVKTNGIDTEEMNNEEILTLEGQIRADQRVLDQVKEVLGGKMETVEQSVADKLEAEEEARLEAETAQKKADAPGIGYEELFRAGDTVKGEFYRFEGKIIQAMASDSDTRIYRVNITADQRYSRTFWEDTILLTVFGETEQRLLEDDIISFVAVSVGLTSYETVMGATIELPIVAASGTDVTITGRAG